MEIDIFETKHVFTPSTPAHLSFIERDNTVNDELVDALQTPGMQIILYGHSGAGKTTLIVNKLNQTYENYIITRCMIGLSFESLILDGFDQLNGYYIEEKSKTKEFHISSDIKSSYAATSALINAGYKSENKNSEKRILPPQLTAPRLAKYFGEAKCCWVLEDFHKIDEKEKIKLSQVMKIFMDNSLDYPDLKIIAVGAVGSARDVIKYDSEMRQRVAEIFVPLMSDQEIAKIIYRGEELLKIKFKSSVTSKVIKFSSGLAAVCHHLCLNMCIEKNIKETQNDYFNFGESEFDSSVEKYVKKNSDTLKETFDKAIKVNRKRKYENTKVILKAILDLEKDEVTHAEILVKIQKKLPGYRAGNLTTYLKQLQSIDRGEILKYDLNSGKFSFSSPFLKAYSFCMISKRKKNTQNQALKLKDPKSVIIEESIQSIFNRFFEKLEFEK